MLGVSYKDVLAEALAGKASVWHYATEFGELWADSFETEQPVVIVWDRAPLGVLGNRDDRLLEPHLTPLDWALAWSLNRARLHKPLPAIVIIDTGVDNWGGSWTWTVRRQLLADMPWVALTAPVPRLDGVNELHDWTMALQMLDGLAVDRGAIRLVDGDWAVATGWVPRPAEAEEVTALEALNQIWTASLIRSDEHHDINNIVGARILLQRVGDEADNDVIRVFLQKVMWVNKDGRASTTWQPWQNNWPKDYLYGEKVYVTLYDDMHEALWEEFLLQFLDNLEINGGAEETPNELIEFLSKRAVFDRRDFIENAYEPSNGQPEIIFLDLRIYGDGSREQFKANTRALLAKAAELADCRTLAWRDERTSASLISNREISEITSWLEAGAASGDPCEHSALLLLPRLLALALPLTPIVLFSSTGQARLREKLKAYRNIFTGFQKPNPLGDPASIESATEALSVALDLAMPMLRRRMQLAYLQNVAVVMESKRPANRPTQHLEIYFDESGRGGMKGNLVSSAFVAQYNDISSADDISIEFNKVRTPPVQYIFPKCEGMSAENSLSELERIEETMRGRGEIRDIISVKCTPPNKTRASASLARFSDNNLDSAICSILEFFIFVYSNYKYDNPTLAIFLPTRRVEETNFKLRDGFKRNFDMFTQGNPPIVETYNDSAALPLVRGWLRRWGVEMERRSPSILSIKSKSISPKNPISLDSKNRGRSTHYIADWAAGFVAYHGNFDADISVNKLRPTLGHRIFKNLHFSDMNFGNLQIFAEVLRSILSEKRPRLETAFTLIFSSPFINSIGRIDLPQVWESDPQEHYWLWAIFPHLTKASGVELSVGL